MKEQSRNIVARCSKCNQMVAVGALELMRKSDIREITDLAADGLSVKIEPHSEFKTSEFGCKCKVHSEVNALTDPACKTDLNNHLKL